MTVNAIHHGVHMATGGPDNVQLGFVPDMVQLTLLNGTVPEQFIWVRLKMCAFTSGGTYEIKPGDTIQGATSKLVRAEVQKVFLTSGTWAGGDAAGFLAWYDYNQSGTFGSENVDLLAGGSTAVGGGGVQTANVAAVTAQTELGNYSILGHATATSGSFNQVTPANGIQPYVGTVGGNQEGFTITADLATAGEIWYWVAFRGTLTV